MSTAPRHGRRHTPDVLLRGPSGRIGVERTQWPADEAPHVRRQEELATGSALGGQAMPGPAPADEARGI